LSTFFKIKEISLSAQIYEFGDKIALVNVENIDLKEKLKKTLESSSKGKGEA